MVTVQRVVFDHLLKVLKIRDRGQIFVHDCWGMRYSDCALIVVSFLNHQFLRVVVNDETVELQASIPKDLLNNEIYEPVSKNNRDKWRKKNIKHNIFAFLQFKLSERNTAIIALCEPRSIHKIEYCCNNIITTMTYSIRRGYYGLCLKEGITKDFNLISNALTNYTTKHT